MVNCSIPLPNLLLIGAAKCGTTSLCKMLQDHPEICFAEQKEVPFFALEELWEQGVEYYLSFFSHYQPEIHKYIGEGSPHYTRSYHDPEKCFRRISSTLPHCKFIFMVRDPVQRIASDIRHRKLMNQPGAELSIKEMVMTQTFMIDDSRYFACLRPYIDFYGLENIYVLALESLLQDPVGIWTGLCTFLGIEPILIDMGVENVSSQRQRLPKPIASLRNRLGTTGLGKLIPSGIKRRVLTLFGRPVPPQVIDPEVSSYILDTLAADFHQFRSLFPYVPDYYSNHKLSATHDDPP